MGDKEGTESREQNVGDANKQQVDLICGIYNISTIKRTAITSYKEKGRLSKLNTFWGEGKKYNTPFGFYQECTWRNMESRLVLTVSLMRPRVAWEKSGWGIVQVRLSCGQIANLWEIVLHTLNGGGTSSWAGLQT